MFKYRFPCGNESEIRSEIMSIMMNDLPLDRTWLGKELHRQGLHFTECDKRVKGYYLSGDEDKHRRGSPIRTCFSGKFVSDGINTYFDVIIYPKLFEFLFIVMVTAMMISTLEPIAVIMASFVFIMFLRGYVIGINETKALLGSMMERSLRYY